MDQIHLQKELIDSLMFEMEKLLNEKNSYITSYKATLQALVAQKKSLKDFNRIVVSQLSAEKKKITDMITQYEDKRRDYDCLMKAFVAAEVEFREAMWENSHADRSKRGVFKECPF